MAQPDHVAPIAMPAALRFDLSGRCAYHHHDKAGCAEDSDGCHWIRERQSRQRQDAAAPLAMEPEFDSARVPEKLSGLNRNAVICK